MLNESMGVCYSNDLSDDSDDEDQDNSGNSSSSSAAAKGTKLFCDVKNDIRRPVTKKKKIGAIADAIVQLGQMQEEINSNLAEVIGKMSKCLAADRQDDSDKENQIQNIRLLNKKLILMETKTVAKFDRMDESLEKKCNDINSKLALILEQLK